MPLHLLEGLVNATRSGRSIATSEHCLPIRTGERGGPCRSRAGCRSPRVPLDRPDRRPEEARTDRRGRTRGRLELDHGSSKRAAESAENLVLPLGRFPFHGIHAERPRDAERSLHRHHAARASGSKNASSTAAGGASIVRLWVNSRIGRLSASAPAWSYGFRFRDAQHSL